MKRTPLRPSTKRIQRKTPMAPVNRERKAREYDRAYSGPGPVDHGDYVRAHPCLLHTNVHANCAGDIEAAHTESGGMGRKADASTLVPLCNWHHRMLHTVGVATFQYHSGISDLRARATELWQRSPANTGYGCQDCEDEGRVCDACWAEREQEREWLEGRTAWDGR